MTSTSQNSDGNNRNGQGLINGVPIYNRPEMENVSLYEGTRPPRPKNHLAVVVITAIALVLAVALVYGLALGIKWLLSTEPDSPDIKFDSGYAYVLAVKTFPASEKEGAAKALKNELMNKGFTLAAIYDRSKPPNSVVVTIGEYSVGREKDAEWAKTALLQAYPDAEAKFIKLKKLE